ncbi:SusC/RagA family TonB-linked outer membrane protein [Cytophagales bacterium WSM2-2]|nr:SusC/RagA family TonB-linked outer membrane protein [Cytophagales bacterium WSM2-2]
MCFSLGFAFSVWAQNRVVTGKVTSQEDGSILPGVNVLLKGTTTGTVTDSNGIYKIDVPSDGGVLVFTFIGMESKEETVGARNTIDLLMKSDIKQLQEVVVNAIGENISKDKMGVVSTSVTGSSVVQSGEAGVINGLAGKAAGVIITRSGGDPGAGSYIQLRGQSTITGDLQPLIVIDGMPMFNDNLGMAVGGTQQQSRLNDINPADIANIEVIKSAAGAALWGSRALNGVIVITTKKAKNSQGRLNASYSATASFDMVNKMPDLQRTFGQGSNGLYSNSASTSYGDVIAQRTGGAETPTGTAYVQFPDGTKRYAIAGGNVTNPHGGKNSQNTYDHTKDVFGTGHFLQHDVNLSSGNDRSQFYASYSNLQQQGIIKTNSDYNKNVARVNFSTLLTDKFHVAINANYSNIRSNRIQQGSNTSGLLLGQLRTAPDYDNTEYFGTAYASNGLATPGKQISYRNPIGASGSPGYDNPLWTMNKNLSYSVVNRFLGNMELNYDATPWLNLKANTGIDTYTDRRTDYINSQSATSLGGAYTEQYIQNSQWNTNLFATAKKKFSDAFAGTFLVGFNYNTRQFNNVGAGVTNFIIPDAPPNLANSPTSNRTPFNGMVLQRTSAGFATINTDIADQLFLNLTGRAEAASTFGPQAQSLFFYPSASAAWQFSKVLGTNDFFNFGKLRVSYGVVGQQPGAYTNLTQFGPAGYADGFGPTLTGSSYGVGGYAISNIAGNPKIRPEKKHEIETGLDIRLLNDKVTFSATAYYNKTTDVILPTQVAPSSGFTNIVSNAGVIENKGLEFSLGVNWLKRNDFSWSSNFIWSAYRNQVLDLAGAQYVFLAGFANGASVATKGQALGTLWGTDYAKGSDGKLTLDALGFPQVSPANSAVGNPNPNYRASFGNTFTYKNVSLYVLLETMVGGQMWNGTQGALFNFGTTQASAQVTTVSAADASTLKTADGKTILALATSPTTARAVANADGTYTFRGEVKDFGGGKVALDQAFYQGAGSGFNVVAPFVQDATWARLREVTLSYSLNSAAFKNSTKLQSLTFGLTGRNLLLWTPYKGIDPDTNLTGATNGRGLDYFQNPNTRSVLLKLTITY